MTRFQRRFVPALALCLAGAATLAGCGQTGPLYLPSPSPPSAQTPAQKKAGQAPVATSASAPAPASR